MRKPAFIIAVVTLAGLALYLIEETSGPLGTLGEHYLIVGALAVLLPALSAWLERSR